MIIDSFIIIILLILPIFVWIFRQWSNKRGMASDARRMNDILKMFGADKNTRDAAIHTWFQAKEGAIQATMTNTGAFNHALRFKISRHLSTMAPQEAAALRIAYILCNNGLLDPVSCYGLHMGLAWGNGRATIDFCDYETHETWKPDGKGSAIDSYMKERGLGSEGAVNQALSALSQASSAHPAVAALRAEMQGTGAQWLSPNDFAGTPYDPSNGRFRLRLGAQIQGSDAGDMVDFTGEGSLITIAPPGSGKTQCQVIPNIILWPASLLILDVKGELYDATHRAREAMGDVYRFAPLDTAQSHSFNPLTYLKGDSIYVWEDAAFLASMLMPPLTKSADPFWTERARGILTAALALVCHEIPPEARSMNRVHEIVSGKDWEEFLADLDASQIPAMVNESDSLKTIQPKMLDSLLQTIKVALAPWTGERVRSRTQASDWMPEDLRGDRLKTVYICLKPSEIDTFAPLLRVFVGLHIRRLIDGPLPSRDASPILFMLDEFPRMQYMPPIEEALEVGRQYGIKLWMIAQSEGQISRFYPNAKGMIGSCRLRVYMNPSLHDGTAEELSRQIGMKQSALDGRRELAVEPQQLAGADYKDDVLCFAAGTKPLRLRKVMAYTDPTISAFVDAG
jgi:type IV secretion system protein VirD4